MTRDEFNLLSDMVDSSDWADTMVALEAISQMDWEIHSRKHKARIAILLEAIKKQVRNMPKTVQSSYPIWMNDPDLYTMLYAKKVPEQANIIKEFIKSRTKQK